MRVAFLIAGAQKAGTTALDQYLRAHPRLCLAQPKEVHFFDTEEHFAAASVDYDRYHAHFQPQPGQLLGESTPIYLYWPDAARRIWQYHPAMRLIVLLRNPIERAYSQWNMQRERGIDPLPFLDALHQERDRCRTALPLPHRQLSYVDRGYYSEQIRRLRRFFPDEQLLFLRTEELLHRPQQTLDRVFAFLGVPTIAITPQIVHARPYPQPMTPAERAFLRNCFADEIRTLAGMLGWDLTDWLREPP